MRLPLTKDLFSQFVADPVAQRIHFSDLALGEPAFVDHQSLVPSLRRVDAALRGPSYANGRYPGAPARFRFFPFGVLRPPNAESGRDRDSGPCPQAIPGCAADLWHERGNKPNEGRVPAPTYLVHDFRRSLVYDGCAYAVERFRGMASGDVRRWPLETVKRDNGQPQTRVARQIRTLCGNAPSFDAIRCEACARKADARSEHVLGLPPYGTESAVVHAATAEPLGLFEHWDDVVLCLSFAGLSFEDEDILTEHAPMRPELTGFIEPAASANRFVLGTPRPVLLQQSGQPHHLVAPTP